MEQTLKKLRSENEEKENNEKQFTKVSSTLSIPETVSMVSTTISVSHQAETFCSLCATFIPDYIPEYFFGEAYNPACHACKAMDSLWDPGDPFSAFPSSTQPVSMVSHWTIQPSQTVQNPSSISMVSHCLKFLEHNDDPENTDEKLITAEEFQELIAEFREQLKADRAKILAEIREEFSWPKES